MAAGQGAVTTIVGNIPVASQGGTKDGTGTSAQCHQVYGIAIKSDGATVYSADTSLARATTVGTRSIAKLAQFTGNGANVVITNDDSTLYMCSFSAYFIAKISVGSGTGTSSVFTGASGTAGFMDGDINAARLTYPYGIAVRSLMR